MAFGRMGAQGRGFGRIGSGVGAGEPVALIILSASTIAEDAGVGDAVGTLSVSNGSGSYTFTLTDDAGGLFAIDGDDLEVDGALDYETATSHSITVEADNGVDDPISRQFTITVTDVEAEGPGAVVLTWDGDDTDTRPDFDVDLPSGQGAPLDAEVDDVLVIQYSINGTDWFAYLSDTLDLGEVTGDTVTVPGVDPLTGGAYFFRARLERDGTLFGPWSNTENVEIVPQITSTNTASVNENATLSKALTADETVTWSIVSGADQARFELSGSTLRWLSNGTKDFETPNDADTNNTYIVGVRATSTATGLTTDQTITVTVVDVSEGVAIAWTDQATSTGVTNTINFGSQDIGAANANRVVAVPIFYRGTTNVSVSSVDIGGVAAAQVPSAKTANAAVNAFSDIW
jgi:hypothetical protein